MNKRILSGISFVMLSFIWIVLGILFLAGTLELTRVGFVCLWLLIFIKNIVEFIYHSKAV